MDAMTGERCRLAVVMLIMIVQMGCGHGGEATTTASTLTVTTSVLSLATIGTQYEQPLAASGGSPPYTWTLAGGALPPGLSVAPSGAITGVPAETGTFAFMVRVTDAAAVAVTTPFTINVIPSQAAVSFTGNIEPIFIANCTSCHIAGGIASFLVLTEDAAFASLVEVPATFSPGLLRVKEFDSGDSVLFLRVSGTAAGRQMPPGAPLSAFDQDLIRTWIDKGALNN